MNKQELIEAIQKKLGKETSKAEAERALNATLECIKAGVKKDKAVQLVGFGTFRSKKRAGRKGVNPQTGKPMTIKPSKTVAFKPGTALKACA